MKHAMKLDCNPVMLINVLSSYGREDWKTTFLYLPIPKRDADREVWAWVQVLQSMGVVRNRWNISPEHAEANLRGMHRHLFDPWPEHFELISLYQARLEKVLQKL